MTKTCSINECNAKHFAKGFCRRHYSRDWGKQNPERVAAYTARHRETRLASQRRWYKTHKEEHNIKSRQHYRDNKAEYFIKKQRRKDSERQSTPPWVNHDALNWIYRTCPRGYHVDHIIPLRGENVSGLNVPWNLQYLPAEENLEKGNSIREQDLRLIEAV